MPSDRFNQPLASELYEYSEERIQHDQELGEWREERDREDEVREEKV